MLLKLRQRMASEESGFTLVELLVVMLILGLLAAIAIPSFFNQRDKAKDADTKTLVRTSETAAETFSTDHDGHYTGMIAGVVGPPATGLIAIEPTLAQANTLTATPTAGGDGYTVSAKTPDTGTVFSITRNADGTTTSDCTNHGKAGCPSDGHWAG